MQANSVGLSNQETKKAHEEVSHHTAVNDILANLTVAIQYVVLFCCYFVVFLLIKHLICVYLSIIVIAFQSMKSVSILKCNL